MKQIFLWLTRKLVSTSKTQRHEGLWYNGNEPRRGAMLASNKQYSHELNGSFYDVTTYSILQQPRMG
ncbi:hypothetical protein K5X82_03235 [Halosquirtibacter xylanolyticus]|uniref:hypothetical protein n=1 Tax=Halosquirtibacter xylanolyticus TaxID=3374599 RepID=UPI003747B4E0|nr:hypothetical protein K5X82_03235 [Prolixibacteraceae bacterium]